MLALGRDAHGPLLGSAAVAGSTNPSAAIRSLADLKVQTAIPFLCGPALTAIHRTSKLPLSRRFRIWVPI